MVSGFGTFPFIGTTSCGLVPQVICGEISSASICISLSYFWRLLAQQFEQHLELRLYEDYLRQPIDLIRYQLSHHSLFGLHKLYLHQQFQLELHTPHLFYDQ